MSPLDIRKTRVNWFARFAVVVSCVTAGLSIASLITPPTLIVTAPKLVQSITVGDAKKLARELLTPTSFKCLNRLFTLESNWRPAALNTSGAQGIGQLLPDTWKNLGLRPSADGRAQLIASLAYISERYGSAGTCGALKHEFKIGWY